MLWEPLSDTPQGVFWEGFREGALRMSFGNGLGKKLVQEEFLIEKKMDVKGGIIIEEEYQE